MSDGTEPSPPPAGQSPSIPRLSAAFLGLLHGHVELFGIELQEQKANSLRILLFAGFALVCGLLLLLSLSVLVLIALWDSYRLQAIIGLCLFYAVATLFCALRLNSVLRDEASPFSATLEELSRDREQLMP
ncbi:phage holin family protein [Pseudomonas sp. LRF_L74]|uniref:phage holin family protein n=1 Tax=Pseudomonas sp. LRF_L74 TaxID=3369422 RepID=UPI003F5EC118